jgi:uncharacterized protein YfiM (DUF2279 family)
MALAAVAAANDPAETGNGATAVEAAAALSAAEEALLTRSDVVDAREAHVERLRVVLRGAAKDGIVCHLRSNQHVEGYHMEQGAPQRS